MERKPPAGAIFEAELSCHVALYDVSHMLLKSDTRKYRRRDPAKIIRAFAHHSGADGARGGYTSLFNSTRYVVKYRKKPFPGAAYTFWLSTVGDLDDEDRLIVYRGQPDNILSWHTGGVNAESVAFCFQGNHTKKPPTADQLAMTDALVPWMVERYDLNLREQGLSVHSRADRFGGRAKRACPGPDITALVDAISELGR